MPKIKVLITDDSALIRKLVRDMLEADPAFEVAGTAKNGKEALEFVKRHPVDVLTLDVEMPVMDGISTLRELMRIRPLPVVMFSSLTGEGAEMTFRALDLGAVDFIEKPTNVFGIKAMEIQAELKEKVRQAATAKIKKTSAPEEVSEPKVSFSSLRMNQQKNLDDSEIVKLIAIGTSTGGPRALQEVIPKISPKIRAPILIVQHMPKGFTKSLAERLNAVSKIRVKEAEDQEPLVNGTVYIAPGDRHLNLRAVSKNKYRISLDDGPLVTGHKPSVDAMFDSLSEEFAGEITTVVMTGMGADGARGVKKLKDMRNSYNIAEDESTCVVFGMPKSAIATGKIDKIVPLSRIAGEINKLMGV